jgi:multiple inositol-polyphosphate phosphatase / 2,3-bisphosphoglycerate 3-phosphatase
LEELKEWTFDKNLTTQYENFLTVPSGWNELKFLALDYQRTFQNVLETRYSKEKYKFGFTNAQRTKASYKAFVEGLKHNEKMKNIYLFNYLKVYLVKMLIKLLKQYQKETIVFY